MQVKATGSKYWRYKLSKGTQWSVNGEDINWVKLLEEPMDKMQIYLD